MKKSILFVLVSFFFIQCSKKTAPIDTSKMAPDEAAFTITCARCHKLPKPGKYTAEEWPKTINRMQKKGKTPFSEEQEVLILSYLSVHAKK